MPDSPQTLLSDTLFAFTPVPLERVRADGWTPLQQERFIRALTEMGSVGRAAQAVGLSRNSAYRLRERAGAESFARAWDRAIGEGRRCQFDYAMDRAINGVTTIRVMRGGSVNIGHGPDMQLVSAALRDVPSVGGTSLGSQR